MVGETPVAQEFCMIKPKIDGKYTDVRNVTVRRRGDADYGRHFCKTVKHNESLPGE